MQLIVNNKDYLDNVFEDIRRAAKYPLMIEYKTVKQMKTKQQLGFIFGGLMGVLRQYFLDAQGELWDAEDLKLMLYYKVGVFATRLYPDGMERTDLITLSRMSKQQASEFISKSLDYMETLPDLIIPPDLRNCWLLHVTKDDIEEAMKMNLPERDSQYLRYQRSLSCIHCGKYGSEVHHIKSVKYAKVSGKSPDWFTISLCHNCHIGDVHGQGQSRIIESLYLYGFDIEIYCRLAYLRWLNKR